MRELFSKEELEFLKCFHCGKDLLNPPAGHLLIRDEWKDSQHNIITDIRWLCLACDDGDPYRSWGWKDIPDLFIPELFISWIIGIITGLHGQRQTFSDEAMENLQILLLTISPRISKEITPRQKKKLENLYMIPRFLGGLG